MEDFGGNKEDISREWQLIADLSKHESLSIFQLEMAYVDGLSTQDSTGASYVNYPSQSLQSLFDKMGVTKVCEKLKVHAKIVYVTDTTHKKAKNGKKTSATADEIRQKTIIETARNECELLLQQRFVAPDFRSNIIEVILIYYLMNVVNSHKKKIEAFLDSLFSFRDALIYFQAQLQGNGTYGVFRALLDNYSNQENMPWKVFIQKYTRFLIRNSFRNNYQRAISLFDEQKELLDQIRQDPFRLFLLPWGVGVGKTALLPAIATMYNRVGHQTLYCVPRGPVRDQNAAYLYRCGIPFAYIVNGAPSSDLKWEIRPSFHCSFGVLPIAYIVDPEFLLYYLRYQEYRKDRLQMEERVVPPSILIPSFKKRYKHLNHYNLWDREISLILDEPSETDECLPAILLLLPRTGFVMSATSCGIVDDVVKAKYEEAFEGAEIVEIPAVNVGVSTTLIAYWHPDRPVISPFTGVKTRRAFLDVLRKVTSSVMWRRFLSPNVLLDWIVHIRTKYPDIDMNTDFEFFTLSFNDISMRVIEWAHAIAAVKNDDVFYATVFEMPSSQDEWTVENLRSILWDHSHLFMRGCVIGTGSVDLLYEIFSSDERSTLRSVDDIVDSVAKHQKQIVQSMLDILKGTLSTKDDELDREERINDLLKTKWSNIPLQSEEVINTREFIRLHNPSFAIENINPNWFNRLAELEEIGSPQDNLVQWRLEPEVIADVPPNYMMWRWKALGSISTTKEFYIKNILDLDRNLIAFMIVDESGAYGLNIKISNAILVDDTLFGKETLLPRTVYFQIAGRVGRQSQEESGFVYLTSQKLFRHLFVFDA